MTKWKWKTCEHIDKTIKITYNDGIKQLTDNDTDIYNWIYSCVTTFLTNYQNQGGSKMLRFFPPDHLVHIIGSSILTTYDKKTHTVTVYR